MMTEERQALHDKLNNKLFCQIKNYKKQEKMNVDHSTSKGYPYDIIMSKDRFKHRVDPMIDRAKGDRIFLSVDSKVYPTFKGISWIKRLFAGSVIDFLMFRIFDYAEALMVAEQQIEDILMEAPFIPEEFGFIKSVGPADVTDNPTKIYTSKYNSLFSIFRNMDEEYEWRLLENDGNGGFKDTRLQLPNHRIAYATFFALGIKIESGEDDSIEDGGVDKSKPLVFEKYKAVYTSDDGSLTHDITVTATSKYDAFQKAKFIFKHSTVLSLKESPKSKNIKIT